MTNTGCTRHKDSVARFLSTGLSRLRSGAHQHRSRSGNARAVSLRSDGRSRLSSASVRDSRRVNRCDAPIGPGVLAYCAALKPGPPCMPLSDAALREIAKVLQKHIAPSTLDEIGAELVEIRGDKEFRDTIERLVHALRMTSGR